MIRIMIHPPSGWFFIYGQSPLLLAMRRTHFKLLSLATGVSSLPCVKGGGAVFRDGGIVLSFIFTTYNPSVISDDSSLYTREPFYKTFCAFRLFAFSSSAIASLGPRDYRGVFYCKKRIRRREGCVSFLFYHFPGRGGACSRRLSQRLFLQTIRLFTSPLS